MECLCRKICTATDIQGGLETVLGHFQMGVKWQLEIPVLEIAVTMEHYNIDYRMYTSSIIIWFEEVYPLHKVSLVALTGLPG